MYIDFLLFLVAVVAASVLFAVAVIVLWFVFGLIINFYKIYLKPKPKPEPEAKMDCTHDHVYCDEGHPEYPFVCSKCRKRF